MLTITGNTKEVEEEMYLEKGELPPERKRIVVIMGRSHASEAPSSFILQGLIDFLISSHEVAQDLRRYLIFKLGILMWTLISCFIIRLIVPVMNPDGVFLGNTMGNLLGQDLNRCWLDPNQFSEPTVFAMRKLIQALDQDPNNDVCLFTFIHHTNFARVACFNSQRDKISLQLDMIIDVHSHISLLGLFIVGNSYSDVYRYTSCHVHTGSIYRVSQKKCFFFKR